MANNKKDLKKAHITIIVSDFEKSLKFYTEILGLKLKNRYENKYAEIDASGMTIGLHPYEAGHKPGNVEGIQIGFAVDNMKEAVGQLKKEGVKFTSEIIDDGWGLLVFFADPDDNVLYLGQMK